MIVHPVKYNSSSFNHRVRRIGRGTVAFGVLAGLWALSLFAASELWHSEVPLLKVRGTRAPASTVLQPALFRIHKYTTKTSQGQKRAKVFSAGIAKRSGVQLSKQQAGFVRNLGQFLHS